MANYATPIRPLKRTKVGTNSILSPFSLKDCPEDRWFERRTQTVLYTSLIAEMSLGSLTEAACKAEKSN